MSLPDLTFANRRPFEQNRLRSFAEARDGVEQVSTRPVVAFVEFTTRCPFSCPQCYRTISVRRGQWMSVDMSDAVLGELTRELFPKVFYLLISGTGELFAAEGWRRYLEALDPFPAFKEIVTSGALLGAEAVAALARRRVLLSVSMDGTTQRSYDLYRGGASMSDVVAGVDRYLAAAGPGRLKVNFTVMAGNLAEVPDMVSFCAARGIRRLDLAPLQITEPLVEDEAVPYERPETHEVFREAIRRAQDARLDLKLPMEGAFLPGGPVSTRFGSDRQRIGNALRRLFRHDPNHAYVDPRRCTEPWHTILVNVFGDVAPCSVREPVGHLHRDSLPAIWNGEAIRGLRRELLAGRSPGRCAVCPKNPARPA